MNKVKERTGIYHEHQEGALCGQHALNNLLQNAMFGADELASIARELDIEEISVLSQAPSQSENMDDTGFFSIQVLQRALKIFEIDLVPYASQEPIAKQARDNPESIEAYICNLGLHWYTIRRFGRQYFDLNSMYYVPEFISNGMLLAHLIILQENGYSVFIVHGTLPECLADKKLRDNPITRTEYESLTNDLPKFIIDNDLEENSKDLHNQDRLIVKVPKSMLDELKKNPNNPRLRQIIYAQLPKEILEGEIPGHLRCSNPQHRHQPKIIITAMPQNLTDEQLMGRCDCPRHRRQHQLVPERSPQNMMDKSLPDNPNQLDRGTRIISEEVTRYIVTESNRDDPHEPPKHHMITSRKIVVMDSSSGRNNVSADNHHSPRMSTEHTNFDQEEDDLLQHVMAESVLSASGNHEDIDDSIFKYRAEQINQKLLDAGIAASLRSNDSIVKQLEEASISIPLQKMDSSLTPAINSELITKKDPSSTMTACSSPLTNTFLSSPTNIVSPSPTDTYSPSPTITTDSFLPKKPIDSSPPPTTTDSTLPKTTVDLPSPTITSDSPLPIITKPDFKESLKLRQRRLKFYGNRDRSIISQAVYLND